MVDSRSRDSWIVRMFAKNIAHDDRFTARLRDMLKIVETMYVTTIEGLQQPDDRNATRQDSINTWDRELSVFEESIRREVLVDISTRHEEFISRRLMTLSLIKDVERMGDYVKNIFRVFARKQGVLQDSYRDEFFVLVDWTRTAFARVDSILGEEDVEEARRFCKEAHEKSRQANAVMEALMANPKRSATPVPTSLVFKFHKRLLRHLFNVASSVIEPYKRVDNFGSQIYGN